MSTVKFGYTICYVAQVASELIFFQQAFGFQQRFLHESGDYGELDTGDTVLAFAQQALSLIHFAGGVAPISNHNPPQATEIALVTVQLLETHRHALACGAIELSPPAQKPWGQSVSYLRSPQGILIELCTPISDL